MFEFEIILAGYTIMVASTSVIISKFVSKKQMNRINKELTELKEAYQRMSLEIKAQHALLKQRTKEY